jgi:hypothetical protein
MTAISQKKRKKDRCCSRRPIYYFRVLLPCTRSIDQKSFRRFSKDRMKPESRKAATNKSKKQKAKTYPFVYL